MVAQDVKTLLNEGNRTKEENIDIASAIEHFAPESEIDNS